MSLMITNFKEYALQISDERCNAYEFKRLASEFCDVLSLLGIKLKPFRNLHKKLFFEKRSKQHQKRVIAYLDLNLSLYKECVNLGESGRDSGKLIWRLFRKLGSVPQSDIIDKIEDDDLVEVYYVDQTPIFRSLKFYQEFSYTVDEALCLPWYQCCRRDIVTTLKMMKFALLYLKGKDHRTMKWTIPFHLVDELNSEREYRFWTQMKYISGVHSHGALTAVISICGVGVVGEKKKLWSEMQDELRLKRESFEARF